ncbi:Omp28-related outer membrane protein [Flagellimonas flava]|uniref:Omp28-related outer membrane protein n=1 Tax=Flagellimonas flava TaxID=570519 RepID=UPI003D65163C
MKTFQIKKIAYYLFLGVLTVLFINCSKDDPKDPEPQQISGCTNPDATNYNANATEDDGSCILPKAEVEGCMDPNSINYNSSATLDNGSCLYNCTDPLAENFNEDAESDNGTCSYSGDLTIQFTENPEEYTRKILLEVVSGTWSGWSVDAPLKVSDLAENYDNVIASYFYNDSGYLTNESFYTYINDIFNVQAIPGGMINRRASIESGDYIMSRQEWEANMEELSDESAQTGMAISTMINNDNELEIFLEAGFNGELEKVALHVYLLEDGLVEGQFNYYSYEYGDDFQSHPFHNELSYITDYVHNDVFREALTPLEGLEIPNEVIAEQGKFQRMFKISDLSNYNTDNLKIVAFVAKNGESIDQKYILNAQLLTVNGDGSLAVQDYD